MPYAPRAHLMPLFYSDGQPAADIEVLPEIKVRNDYLKSSFVFHTCCSPLLFPFFKMNFNQDIDNHPKIEPSIEHDQEQKILLTLPSALTNFRPFTTTTVSYRCTCRLA